MADPIIPTVIPVAGGTQVSGPNGTAVYKDLGTSDSAVPSSVVKANNLVSTANSATNQFNTHSSNLDSLLNNLNNAPTPPANNTATLDNTNDSYTQMLDRISGNSDAATKALIGTIQAQRAAKGATLDNEYDNYKSGLQLLGIQHNTAQATPDLLQGHIQSAENEHQAKLNDLDVQMNKALMDAQTARDTKDLSTLKEKMAYVKDLNTQKQDYLKNIADNMNSEATIAKDQVGGYYDALTKLPPDQQESFLTQAAQKYGISLGALTKAMVDEKQARDKADYTTKDQALTLAQKVKTLASDNATSKKSDAINGINQLLTPGVTDKNGVPYLDAKDGFLTPVGFQTIISEAKADGISRKDIIDTYGALLSKDNLANYKLTTAEIKALTSA